MGVSLWIIPTFVAHRAGWLFITTDTAIVARLDRFERASRVIDVDGYVSLLRRAEAAWLAARLAGNLPHSGADVRKLTDFYEIIPTFYEDPENARLLRGSTLSVIYVGPDYKFLLHSEICTAVQLSRPEMVDPRRRQMPFYCRYLGVWSPGAENF